MKVIECPAQSLSEQTVNAWVVIEGLVRLLECQLYGGESTVLRTTSAYVLQVERIFNPEERFAPSVIKLGLVCEASAVSDRDGRPVVTPPVIGVETEKSDQQFADFAVVRRLIGLYLLGDEAALNLLEHLVDFTQAERPGELLLK